MLADWHIVSVILIAVLWLYACVVTYWYTGEFFGTRNLMMSALATALGSVAFIGVFLGSEDDADDAASA